MANVWEDRKKALEEEYFRRKEQEALEKTRQRLQLEDSEHKQPCFMCCPKCGEKLEEHIFNDIKIDRCNCCHGVWLDAGELERVTSKESRGWLARFWRSTP